MLMIDHVCRRKGLAHSTQAVSVALNVTGISPKSGGILGGNALTLSGFGECKAQR
jgi:hypothetical protein